MKRRRKILVELRSLRSEVLRLRDELRMRGVPTQIIFSPVIKLPPPEDPPQVIKIEPGWPYPPSPTCLPSGAHATVTTAGNAMSKVWTYQQ